MAGRSAEMSKQRGADVHGEELVDLLGVQLLARLAHCDRSVVDEDLDTAELLEGCFRERSRRAWWSEVGDQDHWLVRQAVGYETKCALVSPRDATRAPARSSATAVAAPMPAMRR